MITINDNAYITADKYCLQLFIKQEVEKKDGTKKKEFISQGFYGNLNAALDGYIDYLHFESAENTKAIDVEQLVHLSTELKNNLSKQFNLVSRTNFPIDNLQHQKGRIAVRDKTPS